MGQSISAKLLFLGLDGSGKTSVLKYLEEGPHEDDVQPSVAFNEHQVKYKGVKFSIFDVAGGEKVRELWKHYFEGTDAVVWFVDSTNPDRFEESKKALEITLKDAALGSHLPILVLFTKSDAKNPKSEDDIKGAFEFEAILKGRQWQARKASGKTGEGVYDGFVWLSQEIKEVHKQKKKAEKDSK